MKYIVQKRIILSKKRQKKNEDAFKQLEQLEQTENKIEIDYGNLCENCETEMTLDDAEYVCVTCGLKGENVEVSPAIYSNTSTKCYNRAQSSAIGNGPCNSLNDNGNAMYDSIMRKLMKMQSKAVNAPIPLEILRLAARDYTEICQTLKTQVITTNANDGKTKTQRCNMLLLALIKQQLDKANMSRTDAYICQFASKDKSVLTKSVNKLNNLMKTTIPSYRVDTTSKITAYAYQYLARLEIDTALTDLVVRIIARSDLQTDMINFRTCQDETKVTGTIWLLIRQIGIPIPHIRIHKRCFNISKSTYVTYTDFLDTNRRKFNHLLVGNTPLSIFPIPRSFAKEKEGRGRKKIKYDMAEICASKYLLHNAK
jgi:hypothetical protein